MKRSCCIFIIAVVMSTVVTFIIVPIKRKSIQQQQGNGINILSVLYIFSLVLVSAERSLIYKEPLRLFANWKRRARYPWPDDIFCCKFNISFAVKAPRMALASFPGSGNTWLRYLLEGLTGIFTGDRYNVGYLHVDLLPKSTSIPTYVIYIPQIPRTRL